MIMYNILQTIVILAHLYIINKRLKNSYVFDTLVEKVITFFQLYIISLLIRDLANQYLINKEWVWFVSDYLSVIIFYLVLKLNIKHQKYDSSSK